MSRDLIVPARFRGPSGSGNGGWTAGALAALVAAPTTAAGAGRGPVEVTLRRPPPLDVAVPVTAGVDAATCDVAEARTVDAELTTVAPVAWRDAVAAEASYAGLRHHPFPSCFSCGPARAEGDGLRIFPGRVADSPAGSRRVAATWTPHPSVAGDRPDRASGPVTWAALDCVGGWSGDLEERPMVLGRMTAALETAPRVGRRHVVVGELLGEDGRKTFTAATLYDEDGAPLARAEHVWITVDPTQFELLGDQPESSSVRDRDTAATGAAASPAG